MYAKQTYNIRLKKSNREQKGKKDSPPEAKSHSLKPYNTSAFVKEGKSITVSLPINSSGKGRASFGVIEPFKTQLCLGDPVHFEPTKLEFPWFFGGNTFEWIGLGTLEVLLAERPKFEPNLLGEGESIFLAPDGSPITSSMERYRVFCLLETFHPDPSASLLGRLQPASCCRGACGGINAEASGKFSLTTDPNLMQSSQHQ